MIFLKLRNIQWDVELYKYKKRKNKFSVIFPEYSTYTYHSYAKEEDHGYEYTVVRTEWESIHNVINM